MTTIKLGRHAIRLPEFRVARIAIGGGLMVGGVLGFLPILGFWMVPLGLLVLSVDLPAVRHQRRRLAVRWGRWRQSRTGEGPRPRADRREASR